jgi:ATP-dependent helicase/nuclease subunit A
VSARGRIAIDAATRRAQADASNPRSSAWVSANAGSGKTFVLARRVIRLLLAGTDPGRILCLTFTKAAAAEMAKRVFARLSEWTILSDVDLGKATAEIEDRLLSPAELAEARRLFARALETPGGLKIQTIHAFCERLLHQFPFEANVAGHFEVLEERGSAALADAARRSVLARAARDPDGALGKALAIVLAAASDAAHEEAVAEFVAKRDAVRRWIVTAGSLDHALEELRTALGLQRGDTVASTERRICAEMSVTREDLGRLVRALEAGGGYDRESAARLARYLAAKTETERLEAYLDFVCKSPREARALSRIAGKQVANAWPGLAEQLEAELARLSVLFDRTRRVECFEASAAMLRLADAVIGDYDRMKLARGALDFEDLIVKTANLFARVDASRWVHYKLDRGLDHILVDEAQDTSPRQWQVIRALADEFFAGEGATAATRTLFAVGDEKQSIFSFQGAVPAWFAKTQRELGGIARAGTFAWEDVQLNLSFRSTETVLSAVDRVFAAEAVRRGVTSDASWLEHTAARRSAPGRVVIWPVIEPPERPEPTDWTTPLDHQPDDSPEVVLADRIAATIDSWLAQGEKLEATGCPIRPGGVLVLARTRGAQIDAINRALKTRGIPIAGADRLALTEHIAVMDLIALGQVMLLPEDDLSLAAVLKSPLIGLDEDELFRIAHGRPGTFWDALGAAAGEGGRLGEARAELEDWRARADFLDPHGFFARILGPDRGRERFMRRLGQEAEDVLDEFLAQALAYEETETPSLEGFLDWLAASPTVIKRDTELVRDEVRVMTVHGAKGLEADIVLLVDTGAAPVHAAHDPAVLALADDRESDRPSPLVWMRSRKAMPDKVKARVDYLRERAREEYRRLLYVAMTRARDRLYVCGTRKKLKDDRPQSEWTWQELVRDALEPECTPIEAADGTLEALEWRSATAKAPIQRKARSAEGVALAPPPAWLRGNASPAPLPPRRLAPSAALEIAGEDPSAGRRDLFERIAGENGAALARGRLVHRLLQSLPDHPLETRREVGTRYLAAFAGDWLETDRARLLDEVLKILVDPGFAAVFAPGSRAEVEIAGIIRAAGGEAALSGRIDRLAVTPEIVLIVDYKTNRPAPERLEDVAPAYVAQLSLYRAVLQRLYPRKPVAAAILWTDRPALMEIPSWTLDAALARIAAA